MKMCLTKNRRSCIVLTMLVGAVGWQSLAAQEQPPEPGSGTALAVVHELYDIVTFPAGTVPDWDQLRALFLPESVVVLRSTPDSTSVFSLEGFVQDWLRFIEGSNVKETGFVERIVRTQATEFGDVAHIWVLYEAEIPGWDRPPQPAVDSFQLVRRDGRGPESLPPEILSQAPADVQPPSDAGSISVAPVAPDAPAEPAGEKLTLIASQTLPAPSPSSSHCSSGVTGLPSQSDGGS